MDRALRRAAIGVVLLWAGCASDLPQPDGGFPPVVDAEEPDAAIDAPLDAEEPDAPDDRSASPRLPPGAGARPPTARPDSG